MTTATDRDSDRGSTTATDATQRNQGKPAARTPATRTPEADSPASRTPTAQSSTAQSSGQTDSDTPGMVDRAKAAFADARQRWPWLDHIVNTVQRYNDRQGNVYAASMSFNGILALVPIIMVAFAVGAFVLAAKPDLLVEIKEAIVDAMPGKLGDQLGDVVDSAIASRTTVGVIGLLGAAFTGIGWISGVRVAVTQMFGGTVQRNPIMSKVSDLLTFILLGAAFAVTMAISAVGNSGLTDQLLDWVGLGDASWGPTVVRIVSILVSVLASWMLFTFSLARLTLVPLPFRNALTAGLLTAIVFEIVKSFGGIYLKSVLSSPAGAAFGPILGVMVFAYLASRIFLYAAAWCATDPINADYQVADPLAEREPVVVRPNYVTSEPRVGLVAGVAAGGAALGAAVGWLLRRRDG
ncbi:hypothetical protein GCM10009624_21960 [Gordonia sinesedis]